MHQALLLLALSASPQAQTVPLTPMSPATMEEMSRARFGLSAYAERNEERAHPRVSAESFFGMNPTPVETATTTPPPPATGFLATIGSTPPADCAGAASARYVVGVTNQSVVVQDRTGKQLSKVTLGQFWSDPSIVPGFITDPRILYDKVNDRWVVVTLYESNGKSSLLIAWTVSGDPTGTWRRFITSYDDTPGVLGDFPIVGQASDAIMINVNDAETSGSGGVFFTLPKSYGTALPSISRFRHSAFDLVPITTPDSTHKVIGGFGFVGVSDVVNGALTNTQSYAFNTTYATTGEACGIQAGTTQPLDCGIPDVETAVMRNGVIWAVGWAGHAILVMRISGGVAKTYVIEAPDRGFGYPSIAVNGAGGALIAYSAFSSTSYAGAAYSYIDPAGNLSASATLKNGDAAYTRANRWGDYTTAVVDPADDLSFWTVQLYAATAGNWGTWWGYVKVAAPARRHAAGR